MCGKDKESPTISVRVLFEHVYHKVSLHVVKLESIFIESPADSNVCEWKRNFLLHNPIKQIGTKTK